MFLLSLEGTETMNTENEKRKHKRLPVKTDILCKKVGGMNSYAFTGNTVDISTNGLLIESCHKDPMDKGDLFNVELGIPETNDSGQMGGKVSAYARVIRVVELEPQQRTGKKHIAFQFCCRPQFDI